MRRDRQSKGRASAPIDSSVIIPTPYAQPQRERTYTGTWGRSERADRRGSRAVTHVRRRGSRGTWLSVKVTTCRCRQDIGDACSRVMVSGRWQRRKVTRGKRVSYTNLNPKEAHQARPRRREPPNASRVAPLALMPSTATRLACRAMPTASAGEVITSSRSRPSRYNWGVRPRLVGLLFLHVVQLLFDVVDVMIKCCLNSSGKCLHIA